MDQQNGNSTEQHKPEPVREIRSPKGIELDADPPDTVRVSKRAAILAVGLMCALGGAFGFGVYQRRQQSAATALTTTDNRRIVPATTAAKEITKDIPAGVVNLADEKQVVSAPAQTTAPPRAGAVAATSSGPPQPAQPQVHAQPAPVPQVPYREPTPEEKRVTLAFERRIQAELAPTATGASAGRSTIAAQPAPAAPTDASSLTALAQALVKPAAVQTRSGDAAESDDAALQARKETYLARARTGGQNQYLKSTRMSPVSDYEIKAGWEIPAALEQGLNSDLPGELKALVTANVYDTATGRHLLIPQGSRLIGTYDSVVAYGQSGVQVVWNRIIFPDGSSIDLGGMIGQDAQGFSGFRHSVDNHYKRLIGGVVLSSLFSAGFQLSQSRRGNVLQTQSSAEVAASAVGREVSQVGAQITRKNLNVQPTVRIPIGYRFAVRVNRDVLFQEPYTD